MPNETIEIDRGWHRIKAELALAETSYTKIGIQSDAGTEPDSGVDLVDIAYWNHFGTSDGRIPARPFIKQAVDRHRHKIDAMISEEYDKIKAGTSNTETALKRIGEFVEGLIKQDIGAKLYKPNAPATIRQKTVGGKVGDTPLINTGHLRNSIRHQESIGGLSALTESEQD